MKVKGYGSDRIVKGCSRVGSSFIIMPKRDNTIAHDSETKVKTVIRSTFLLPLKNYSKILDSYKVEI